MRNEKTVAGAGGRSTLGLLAVALVLFCILSAFARPVPVPVRLWASFLLVLVLPGAGPACSRLLEGLDVWERIAASYVGSLVVVAAAGILSKAVGWGLAGVLWLVPCVTTVGALIQWRTGAGEDWGSAEGGSRRARHLCAAALLVISLVMASGLSGEMGSGTDAFDHIATVREIQDTGDLLPLTTSYKYPEAPLPDPRKGFFHAGIAAMCVYSGQDPVVVWSWLPKALLPLTLLVVFCLGRTLLGSAAGGVVSAAFWMMCFGGAGSRLPIQLGYAHNASEIATWVVVMLLLKYAAGGRSRLAVFSAAGVAALCFIHVSSIVLALTAWGSLFCAVLVFGGPDRRELGLRVGRVGLLWLLLGVPAASVKMLMSYAPANPLQLQSQNLMYLTDVLYTVNPMWIFSWLGTPGALAVALAVWLAARRPREPGRLYIVGASLLPVAVVVNPVLVPVFYSVVGYLVERFTWVVPYPYLLAGVLLTSLSHLRAPVRVGAKIGTALVAALILASMGTTGLSRLPRGAASSVSYESWMPALEYLRDHVSEPAVVASDMLTSYSIPAFTRHHVVSTLHQHGSPNDPRGVDRIVALLDIMNPHSDPACLKRRIAEWEVDYILVNHTFDRRYKLYFTEIDPASLKELDAFLADQPGVFRKVFGAEGLDLYAVDREAIEDWDPPTAASPPYVLPAGEKPPGARVGVVFGGEIELVSVALDRGSVERGEELGVTCYWRGSVERISYDLPWTVQIRIQRDYPKGRFFSPSYSKIYRKTVELMRGERYRWRQSHLPAAGAFPPPRWGDLIVRDDVAFRVPRWMKPGSYEVTVSIGMESVYPNFTLRDFLRDDDRYSGVSVGEVNVH